MGGVLEGVRVLDFGRYIAGPYCATLLAEFGAEVIRVEKRDGSEDRFVAPVGEGGRCAVSADQPKQKVYHARSDEAGGTGGDASAGYDRGRGRRQSAAADSARDEV
jgi:CoA-transferase family III